MCALVICSDFYLPKLTTLTLSWTCMPLTLPSHILELDFHWHTSWYCCAFWRQQIQWKSGWVAHTHTEKSTEINSKRKKTNGLWQKHLTGEAKGREREKSKSKYPRVWDEEKKKSLDKCLETEIGLDCNSPDNMLTSRGCIKLTSL